MTNKTKILIVDDDADVLETTAEILRMSGYETAEAGCGDEALLLNAQLRPDIYLLDVKMPGISGLELLKELYIRDTCSEAIMMTGHESLEDAQQAMALGAQGYITKPLSADKLLENIARAEELVAHAKTQLAHERELKKRAEDSARDLASAWRIMEDREILMDGILNSMGEGIVAVDCDENIVYMNESSQNILCLRFSECAGQCLGSAIARHEWAPQLIRMIRDSSVPTHSNRLISIPGTSGDTRHFMLRLSDFCDTSGARVGSVINLIEQTAKVESERLRDFFLSTVAHELRTPVTIIKNYLGILKLKQWRDDDYSEIIADMDATGARLSALVHNIIALSSLANADFAPKKEPVDLELLCNKWISENSMLAEEKNISMTVENRMNNGNIRSDSKLLATAIACVLSNAVKFNKQNGTVRILLQSQNGAAGIRVADSGIGMPEAVRENLFSGFMQAEDPLTRYYEGIGVGLYLTRRVMEKLGGSIEVESKEGEGSRFTLKVPV